MSLKSVLFDLKEGISNQSSELSEKFVRDLETQNNLGEGSLVWYFEQLTIIKGQMKEIKNKQVDSRKLNRKWSKNEISLMLQYISERQEEWGVNITEVLDEVATLLNRGYQSVNYKYYSLIKSNQIYKDANPKQVQFITIQQKSIPVFSTEVVASESDLTEFNRMNPSIKNDDLLEVLSGLLSNIQKLPGINLNDLLKGLYQLTNMALQNQNEQPVNERAKLKVNQENKLLKEKLTKIEQRLILEKRRNDELHTEVLKLAREIRDYNQLGDTAKIQNLKSYNQSLSHIIEGFELNQKVGS